MGAAWNREGCFFEAGGGDVHAAPDKASPNLVSDLRICGAGEHGAAVP